jgi:hypothetical protein
MERNPARVETSCGLLAMLADVVSLSMITVTA